MKWTVEFCNCGGFEYCDKCELPCEHDRLCRRCKGWEWYPDKVVDLIMLLVLDGVSGFGPYRTKREAWQSIEE